MPDRALPAAWARRIWQILVEECGAPKGKNVWGDEESFVRYLSREVWGGHEYRFMGALGFGGKFYNDGWVWRVGCYGGDRTPKRDAMIAAANARLAALREERDQP